MTEPADRPAEAAAPPRPTTPPAGPPTAPPRGQPAGPPPTPVQGRTAVGATALFAEAASKSGLLWVDVPGDRAWPVWHAWADDTVWVVSGPGEQDLPWLPDQVELVLRSRDTGGRLLRVRASVRIVGPADPQWEAATTALKASRLNAVDDVVARWAEQCTVRALHPFGAFLEAPGRYDDHSGAAPVPPSPATTTGWRPWHLGGRPLRRRGTRLPDDPHGDG